MAHNQIAEISSGLRHQDYALAVRRLLDTCLDTEDAALVGKAIELSRYFRALQKQEQVEEQEAGIVEKAQALLNEAAGKLPGPKPFHTLMQVSQLVKTYSTGNFALEPVNLHVNAGDVWGVVGENGNGKTTLLRCLAGQLRIDKGTIVYTGLSGQNPYVIRSTVAFIPQRIPRWYGKLKDNLHFSASICGVSGNQNKMMVDFMLERLGLAAYASLTWDQISSGYRTRFELARVLLQKPSLLILDEPLANLDINAQQTILTDLRYMARSVNHPMGVILSSQQLHEVEKVADKVMFIRQGKCIIQSKVQDSTLPGFVIEIETTASRDKIAELVGEDGISLQYNGGFYTISSAGSSVQEILDKLVSGRLPITYFRDITYSTKRYFNS